MADHVFDLKNLPKEFHLNSSLLRNAVQNKRILKVKLTESIDVLSFWGILTVIKLHFLYYVLFRKT